MAKLVLELPFLSRTAWLLHPLVLENTAATYQIHFVNKKEIIIMVMFEFFNLLKENMELTGARRVRDLIDLGYFTAKARAKIQPKE